MRIYKDVNNWLFDRDWVVAAMEAAHKHGCGAEVLARFSNGLVYRFTAGEVLDPRIYDDQQI